MIILKNNSVKKYSAKYLWHFIFSKAKNIVGYGAESWYSSNAKGENHG